MDAGNNTVKEISAPIYQAKGWMKLVGVLSIIYGVLSALTVVGIIIAWLPIWMGVILFKSASSIEQAYLTGSKDAAVLSLAKLKTYFTIMGVLTLIGIIMGVLGFFFGMFGAFMGMQGMHGMEGFHGMPR